MTRASRLARGISRRRPEAVNPGEWPLADYNAFVLLFRSADLLRDEEHDVDRVHAAADEIGLDPHHWLVREVLMCVYGKFPVHGGTFYAEDADAFFRNATDDDLRDRNTVEWARRLATGRQR